MKIGNIEVQVERQKLFGVYDGDTLIAAFREKEHAENFIEVYNALELEEIKKKFWNQKGKFYDELNMKMQPNEISKDEYFNSYSKDFIEQGKLHKELTIKEY